MKASTRPATWLEVARVPQWQPQGAKVCIHPVVGPKGECYALTLDSRWLCGTDGSVTLFHGLGAAVRFLQLAHVNDFEAGEPADLASCVATGVQCLGVRGGRNLRPCTSKGPGCPSWEEKPNSKS